MSENRATERSGVEGLIPKPVADFQSRALSRRDLLEVMAKDPEFWLKFPQCSLALFSRIFWLQLVAETRLTASRIEEVGERKLFAQHAYHQQLCYVV